MTLSDLIRENGNDLTDHDLAVLADWAGKKKFSVHPDWQRAYALLREGADLLLRRRARASVPVSKEAVEAKDFELSSSMFLGKQLDFPAPPVVVTTDEAASTDVSFHLEKATVGLDQSVTEKE